MASVVGIVPPNWALTPILRHHPTHQLSCQRPQRHQTRCHVCNPPRPCASPV